MSVEYACINTEDDAERERNSVLSITRADTGELLCDTIEQFGTKVDV